MTRLRPLAALVSALVLLAPFALAEGASGASAATVESCPVGAPCVVVTVVAGTGAAATSTTRIVTQGQVQAGDVNAAYHVRSSSGQESDPQYRGLSIRQLVQNDVGIPITAVSGVDIMIRTLAVTLNASQLADPSTPGYPFEQPLLPAIFTASDQLGYIEPLRNDTDPTLTGQTFSDGAVALTVHVSAPLVVPVITTPETTVKVGAVVPFAASVPSAPQTTYSYTWSFDDGSDIAGTGNTQTHRFTTAGAYNARVIAAGSDGTVGISNPLLITVAAGSPPPAATPTPSTPTTGAGTGATGPTTGPVTSGGSLGGGTPSSTPNSSQAKNGSSSIAGRAAAGSSASNSAAGREAAPTENDTTPGSDGSTRVSGILIAGANSSTDDLSAPNAGQEAAAQASRRATVDSNHTRVLATIGAVALLVALLAFGIMREARNTRPRSTRPRRTRPPLRDEAP